MYGVVQSINTDASALLGSMTINGSLVVDTSINKLTGSPDFVSWSVFNQSGTIDLPPTITKTLSKHAASWRDF